MFTRPVGKRVARRVERPGNRSYWVVCADALERREMRTAPRMNERTLEDWRLASKGPDYSSCSVPIRSTWHVAITVVSVRLVYQRGDDTIVETRQRSAIIQGMASWW